MDSIIIAVDKLVIMFCSNYNFHTVAFCCTKSAVNKDVLFASFVLKVLLLENVEATVKTRSIWKFSSAFSLITSKMHTFVGNKPSRQLPVDIYHAFPSITHTNSSQIDKITAPLHENLSWQTNSFPMRKVSPDGCIALSASLIDLTLKNLQEFSSCVPCVLLKLFTSKGLPQSRDIGKRATQEDRKALIRNWIIWDEMTIALLLNNLKTLTKLYRWCLLALLIGVFCVYTWWKI